MNGPEDFERPADPLPPLQAARLATLLDTLDGAPISDAERRTLEWLCGFESHTVVHLGAVIRRLTRRAEVLDRRANAAIDDARSRHLEADRYRGQLADLCEWAGIEPGDDPYEALLAYIRGREPGGGRT